jgi:hypothetical protein
MSRTSSIKKILIVSFIVTLAPIIVLILLLNFITIIIKGYNGQKKSTNKQI